MPYYDIYDSNDNLIQSNVFISGGIDESPSGGSGEGALGWIAIFIWIMNFISPFVLIYFCIKSYFNGGDYLLSRIGSAIPMIIAIIIQLFICYFQIEMLILKAYVFRNYLVKEKNKETQKNEIDDFDELNRKIWEKRLNKINKNQTNALKFLKIIRYSLIFVMLSAIILSNIPGLIKIGEEELLPIIGPLFAYSYILGIYEYIVLWNKNLLEPKSWMILIISFIGGAALGYFIYTTAASLEPLNPADGEWFFTLKNLELFVVLICMLAGFEIGLKIYKKVVVE